MGEVRFPPPPPLGVEFIHRTFALNKLRWQMSWEWSCWIVSNVKMHLRLFLPRAFYYSFTVICIPQLYSRWGKKWFLHLILSEPAGSNNKTAPCPWLKLGYYGKLSSHNVFCSVYINLHDLISRVFWLSDISKKKNLLSIKQPHTRKTV